MIDSDMKKITNLLYMLAVLLLASCSDFLDKSPKNTVDPETTVTDDVAIALTNACYRTLQSSNMYNQRIWTLDIVAGNSLVGAGGGTDGLETIQASNFITQSDNGMALYMWRSPWVGIGQCNIVLNSLLEAEAVSERIKNRCLGEAYFLRAHYYYVLVRLYGGVPLRLAPYNPGERIPPYSRNLWNDLDHFSLSYDPFLNICLKFQLFFLFFAATDTINQNKK